jgi:two-component system chemotaxis family response regulator WspR
MNSAETDLAEIAASTARRHQSVRILLVDDQMMIGEAVRRALVGEPDMEFHFCSSPKEALVKARGSRRPSSCRTS